ncbi:hypothetical protein [Thermosporothrix hazakensis]|uniref:hypothetical protein n=1 Tax=Thermosporothrix hazakensis TaxID=644383 RepID=UPI0014754857|nr:hypothetical protein [Thermosporothrix hazakensis]
MLEILLLLVCFLPAFPAIGLPSACVYPGESLLPALPTLRPLMVRVLPRGRCLHPP